MLPTFRYHPDPLKSGSIVVSEAPCAVCEAARGYVYDGPVYGTEPVRGRICPWCIADGSAAERFALAFTADWALVKAGIHADVITEVTTRTPGFTSWQGEEWLAHCSDACEFHGDLGSADLKRMSAAVREQLWPDSGHGPAGWETLLLSYAPGGDPSIYWFRCRHCAKDLFTMDCS